MNYMIRPLKESEYPLLEDFLYEAIFQPDEKNLAPRSIIQKPELQVYIEGFGTKKDDYCFCAEVEGKVVGAVWVRTINGFGNIDNHTPEFAISLYKQFRGQGIGTALMRQMLTYLRSQSYLKTSLAVQKANYALKMYQSVGFNIIGENDQEYIMECILNK